MTEALDLADPYLVKAIWKPEVFFPNAKEANFQFVTVPNVLIRIHPDGEILYILRYVIVHVFLIIYLFLKVFGDFSCPHVPNVLILYASIILVKY